MDADQLRQLAALDQAAREAYAEDLLARAERAAPWQRPVLLKRLEELRASSDGSGEWDRPEAWIPPQI